MGHPEGPARAAERGATTHALMSMLGGLSIAQAELYIREAERRRLGLINAHLLGTNGESKSLTMGP